MKIGEEVGIRVGLDRRMVVGKLVEISDDGQAVVRASGFTFRRDLKRDYGRKLYLKALSVQSQRDQRRRR